MFLLQNRNRRFSEVHSAQVLKRYKVRPESGLCKTGNSLEGLSFSEYLMGGGQVEILDLCSALYNNL